MLFYTIVKPGKKAFFSALRVVNLECWRILIWRVITRLCERHLRQLTYIIDGMLRNQKLPRKVQKFDFDQFIL